MNGGDLDSFRQGEWRTDRQMTAERQKNKLQPVACAFLYHNFISPTIQFMHCGKVYGSKSRQNPPLARLSTLISLELVSYSFFQAISLTVDAPVDTS